MKSTDKANLSEYAGIDRVVSSYELDQELKDKPDANFKIYSGIPSLDNMTDGFHTGDLVVVSGPSGHGKTLLCQTLTYRFCERTEPPLWFSFEVPPRQFLNQFNRLPFFMLPRELKSGSQEWFEERCLESWQKNRSRIVIVDHLHYLGDMFRMKNPSLELGQIVRRLKRFCVEENLIGFLVAHIGKIADGVKATRNNIRDSSFVVQEADTVLLVQRKKEENEAWLSVEKCRRTGVLDGVIRVKKIDGKIIEMTKDMVPF